MAYTTYIIFSGPTPSHMHDSQVFSRLRDAELYALGLPETPHGRPRPARIVALDFKDAFAPHPYRERTVREYNIQAAA
ncbi:hypothetical protein DFO67_1355 [Modicisalibacter xianhensis]|uniref:Uncharacterized protein n=1 Tax=Modicisalibacter xianhensis TaxID=442341 RepID=A0A4R8FDQ4_9GAMM|nr:hypothetical protein [Halomonas xianhensis]TDX21595.1 hypothetical protein DFO67_1355 [Halomonas xianhensis]